MSLQGMLYRRTGKVISSFNLPFHTYDTGYVYNRLKCKSLAKFLDAHYNGLKSK